MNELTSLLCVASYVALLLPLYFDMALPGHEWKFFAIRASMVALFVVSAFPDMAKAGSFLTGMGIAFICAAIVSVLDSQYNRPKS